MILIDTNILVFAHNQDSPHNEKAIQLLKDALEFKIEACIAHQNLLEFFSVITSPKRIDKPLSTETALSWIKLYLESSNIKKVSPSQNTLESALALTKHHKLAKADIFDSYLAATMQENNIPEIYTNNISDFKKFHKIKAINPFS